MPLISLPFPACQIVTNPGLSVVDISLMFSSGTNIQGEMSAPGLLKCWLNARMSLEELAGGVSSPAASAGVRLRAAPAFCRFEIASEKAAVPISESFTNDRRFNGASIPISILLISIYPHGQAHKSSSG